jgi:hypothetical protein
LPPSSSSSAVVMPAIPPPMIKTSQRSIPQASPFLRLFLRDYHGFGRL